MNRRAWFLHEFQNLHLHPVWKEASLEQSLMQRCKRQSPLTMDNSAPSLHQEWQCDTVSPDADTDQNYLLPVKAGWKEAFILRQGGSKELFVTESTFTISYQKRWGWNGILTFSLYTLSVPLPVCHGSCTGCVGSLPTQCTSCPFPLALRQGQCLSACGEGFYQDHTVCKGNTILFAFWCSSPHQFL